MRIPTTEELIEASLQREMSSHLRFDSPREALDAERRHRELLIALTRLAVAIEKGNDITDRVVQGT